MIENKIQIVHLRMVKEKEVSYGREKMDSPETAAQMIKNIVRDMLCGMDRECMVVCATDTKMKPVCIQVTGIGAINSCQYSIPEIFKTALLSNAAYILLFHNHPSGDVAPSRNDIKCTLNVKRAGRLLGIPLQDHIILGENDQYYSFKENSQYFEPWDSEY